MLEIDANIKISNLASSTGCVSLWVSSGDSFSTKEVHLESTKFIKNIEKKGVYSQGQTKILLLILIVV